MEKYLDSEILNEEDAAELLLAAILDGQLNVLDDHIMVELELMDAIAVRQAGSEFLVHWNNVTLQ